MEWNLAPLAWALVALQGVALVVVAKRLAPGRHRVPPVPPAARNDAGAGRVSVVVPARNEGMRIAPCLAGLRAQDDVMREAIIVDGASTDDTRALIDAAHAADRRIGWIAEPPRPPGMVGRPWAIAAGCRRATGEWILVVDADVAPRAGMVGGALAAATAQGLDAVSFAPRIVAPSVGARMLQPSFVTTLVYRFGAAGTETTAAERAVANGQCLLLRRETLERHGGYERAASSFCDDVRIVRHLAASGARVGFLDGTRLFDVSMYRDAAETWRAWPRSLNMRDATRPLWRWLDALLLTLAQVLPIPVLVLALHDVVTRGPRALTASLIATNGALLLVRILLLRALAPSFARGGWAFWLSPLADPPAALRVVGTMVRPPREWRGNPRPRVAAPAATL